MNLLPQTTNQRTKRVKQRDEKDRCSQRLAGGCETLWGSVSVHHCFFLQLLEAPKKSLESFPLQNDRMFCFAASVCQAVKSERWGEVTGCDMLFAKVGTIFGD